MSQDITLMGASYSAVPAVTLPKTGGGTASFTDVTDTTAAAADVASGKYFYTAAGVRTAGTNSGGGGGGGPVLLATLDMGTINTSSTTATDTGKRIFVDDITGYDVLIVETTCTKTYNRHFGTVAFIWLYGTSTVEVNTNALVTTKLNYKVSWDGIVSSRANSSAYGIYPYTCALATEGSKQSATIPMYQRYNSTNTGTINGAYTARVYGMNVYDLIGG